MSGRGNNLLIQKPKQPQRYLVVIAYLHIIRNNIGFFHIFDLFDVFVSAAHLECVALIEDKIPAFWIIELMPVGCRRGEKSLPLGTLFMMDTEDGEEVGIVEIELFRFGDDADPVGFGAQYSDESGSL